MGEITFTTHLETYFPNWLLFISCMFGWLNSVLIAFASREGQNTWPRSLQRGQVTEKQGLLGKRARSRECGSEQCWDLELFQRQIYYFFYRLSLLLTLVVGKTPGKHLENNIHHSGDSNVTPLLCLEQKLLVLLHPVQLAAVQSGQLHWFIPTVFTKEHVPSLAGGLGGDLARDL